ncbi:VOC family protein [Apilactobacillus sp. TMW 2.2459]|uniref:VOC family protein n=1 Tax=Apilactobacillus xinyiensis TaxID=2841032 RepID=UPI00200FE338|nr:VOC family protein [Apilactobacillus xinyiensis]MCL0311994.1 VOC family protein [Apilactobacillus xinyiensis]
MKIKDIDHITIAVENLERCMRFYHEVLDLPIVKQNEQSILLQIGKQKIKLVLQNKNDLKPNKETAASASFCVIAKDSLKDIQAHLANYGVNIVDGPKLINGSNGLMNSIHITDPEGNLIEICEYKK